MPRWGKVDFRELKALQKKLEKLAKGDYEKFCQDCAKELAARLLSLVIPRTPTGIYDKNTGKMGGTLKRGWSIGQITKQGDTYSIEVINPTHYASYVEYGHRTPKDPDWGTGEHAPPSSDSDVQELMSRGRTDGWVPGKFMLTKSEQQLSAESPQVLERLLEKKLREVFDGK